ncbi:unnamed protein product [Symbiodinium natans]|uniref:Uncharacterized protein n=1 Tax=Symbiodinium natans TaxID=878477 RepID=A0A812SJQ0_9DINO|nr:unnamed protein product [Symbiodinium natans]
MLALLSPAKTMDMSPSATTTKSKPSSLLSKRTEEILAALKKMPAKELKRMMKLSDELTKQTAERFAKFKAQPSKAACLAFDGPAFRGFAAKGFSKADEKHAQRSVRILCALYGVLKPYDLIRPYRLEMTSKLRGSTMYDVWGDSITDALAKDLKASKAKFLVNCASQEFWKAVRLRKLPTSVKVITCDFAGPSSLVKQARGAMCKYIVQKRVKDPAGLKKFTGDAQNRFAFNAAKSSDSKLMFTRGGATKRKTVEAAPGSKKRKRTHK